MPLLKITSVDLLKELEISYSRSSGPGGQHVNKVNTKASLRFDVTASSILTDNQRTLLLKKLANKLTNNGVLVLASQEARSQLANKELVIKKLDILLEKAFEQKVKRIPTKPTKSSNTRRLESKKHHSLKKANRQKP